MTTHAPAVYAASDAQRRHEAESLAAQHSPRCDPDLCAPECAYRAWARLNDYPYPGAARQ